jgi:DNA polymerase I-like protein with 3'-5' exonuclease and polymerase domains
LTSKNCPNTDGKRTLIKFPDLGIVQALRKFKAIEKQLATYSYRWIMTRDEKDPLTKKSGYVDPDTGRLHPDFRQCGADTGRPSCTDPNVLNLPRDPRYRKAFISRPGYDMVCKDCAGQELRILTEYSQEPAWIKAFLNKQDVHSISSEMINKELWKSATIHVETTLKSGKVIPPCAYYYDDRKKCDCPGHKTIRDVYKAFNFGMVYDKSDFTFAIELNKDKDDVAVMTSAWKAEFAITQRCLEKLRNDGYNKHEARDLAGGRRIMRSISYEQAKIASYEKFAEKTTADRIMKTMEGMIAAVKREAGNMPIQGTGARLMMLAMGCGFDPEGKPYLWHTLEPKHQALLLNYVYDEFVVESPEPNSVSVGEAIEDAIIRAGGEFVKCVPMESDGMISKRWQK